MKSCFGECETDPALRRLWDADYVSGITIVASTTLPKVTSVFGLPKEIRTFLSLVTKTVHGQMFLNAFVSTRLCACCM